MINIIDKCKLNFFIDLGLLISGIAVGITGILKLKIFGMHIMALNPIHGFAGIVFVALALLHIILHLNWLKCTAKQMLTSKKKKIK